MHPTGSLGDGEVAFLVEFADVHEQGGELGEEQVAGLATQVVVTAGNRLLAALFAPDPIPQRAGAVRVGEDDDILVAASAMCFQTATWFWAEGSSPSAATASKTRNPADWESSGS